MIEPSGVQTTLTRPLRRHPFPRTGEGKGGVVGVLLAAMVLLGAWCPGMSASEPDKLCINWWGDAAIGFTGMDFETAARERIPILSVLSNNSSMAIELKIMPTSTRRYRSTDISGNYAEFARSLGGYGERVTDPDEISRAFDRAVKCGKPAVVDVIVERETDASMGASLDAVREFA